METAATPKQVDWKISLRGHYEGADKLEEVLHWCDELGVEIFSIWIFSLDNFKRADDEVEEFWG